MKSHAFAPSNQGGSGVTVAEFRAMSMIPDEVIEQVRDNADLLSIIGESVDLKRTGADYRGACPFHGGGTIAFRGHSQEGSLLLLRLQRVR